MPKSRPNPSLPINVWEYIIAENFVNLYKSPGLTNPLEHSGSKNIREQFSHQPEREALILVVSRGPRECV
jgi:hypothetical protein